jgi:hypothetical protein
MGRGQRKFPRSGATLNITSRYTKPVKAKGARKPSKWNKLVKELLLKNPNVPFAQVVKKASSIYKKY